MKQYPIQDGPTVPWSYMAPHESQAQKNHSQTLARLAERGGLGAAEAELIVTAQPLYPKSGEWDWAELKRRWVERAERVNNAYLAAAPPDGERMTPEEFAERMAALESCEAESRHMKADELMAEVLRALGYGAGMDVFDRFQKWYA